jgi:hypothetical protein
MGRFQKIWFQQFTLIFLRDVLSLSRGQVRRLTAFIVILRISNLEFLKSWFYWIIAFIELRRSDSRYLLSFHRFFSFDSIDLLVNPCCNFFLSSCNLNVIFSSERAIVFLKAQLIVIKLFDLVNLFLDRFEVYIIVAAELIIVLALSPTGCPLSSNTML